MTDSEVFEPETRQKQKLNNVPAAIEFTEEKLKPGTSAWLSTCEAIRDAMEEYGYFVAVYDEVSPLIRNQVLLFLKELFDLPTETKSKNTNPDMPYFGYLRPMPDLQLYESMAFIDATEMEAIHNFANLMWPSGNNQFCETMHSYTKQVSQLEQMITRMLFESYGVEKYYESHVKSTTYLLRANAYKVTSENEAQTVGAIAHTDTSFITVLQQNEVRGFEVQAKDGNWISIDFPPSSFVVIAGDAILAWSDGRINPPLHRVTMTGDASRYSLGLFSFAKGILHVPEEPADAEKLPSNFKSFDHFGLFRFTAQNLDLSAMERVKIYCGASEAV